MLPILYDEDKVFYKFNGKGKITDCISCVVHEELDGDFSLELQYPVTGPLLNDLYDGGVICAHIPRENSFYGFEVEPEFFYIYKHSVPLDGVVTFYALHYSRKLADSVYISSVIKGAFSIVGTMYPAILLTADTGTISWSTYNGGSFSGQYDNDGPKSTLSALIGEENSWRTLFNGEVFFKCSCPAGPSITKTPECVINLLSRRGSDKGATIRFSYDLQNLLYEKDSGETFNAVVPFWDDGNGTKTYVTGYIVQPSTPITPIKAVPMDFTSSFNIRPPGAVLAQAAQDWLDANTPWVSAETIEADFVNGAEIYPYGSPVFLGDDVSVEWPDAGVSKKMRVIAYDFDVLAECYTKVQLGTQPTNFVAVTGIDGGGGASVASGGGASVSTIISPTTTTGTSESITASDYDFLVFTSENNSGRVYGTTVIPAALIANNNVSSVYVYAGNTNYYDAFTVSSTSVTLSTVTGGVYGAVYGVKIN